MSKVLEFVNGVSKEFTDTSTIQDCVTVLTSYADIDAIRTLFTEANLKGATFDGQTVENTVPVKVTAEAETDGNVTVHFLTRAKTDMEIVKEEITELQEAMVEE